MFFIGSALLSIFVQIILYSYIARMMYLQLQFIDNSYNDILKFIYYAKKSFYDDNDLYLRIISINRAYLKAIYQQDIRPKADKNEPIPDYNDADYSGLFKFVFEFDNKYVHRDDKWNALQSSVDNIDFNRGKSWRYRPAVFWKNLLKHDLGTIFINKREIIYKFDALMYNIVKPGFVGTQFMYLLSRIICFILVFVIIIMERNTIHKFSFQWFIIYIYVFVQIIIVIWFYSTHLFRLHSTLSYIMIGYHSLEYSWYTITFEEMETEYMELYIVHFANELITKIYGPDIAIIIMSYLNKSEEDDHDNMMSNMYRYIKSVI